ncbi:hypothetical protein ABZ567_30490 [Streptomyces sp. NPDC016459]|uniref:vanadium-dependent haloperoxidase n=1 Tax=Streptomyces sp. NPDC016459 TaxID=3157190 RepID=UPI0033C643CF
MLSIRPSRRSAKAAIAGLVLAAAVSTTPANAASLDTGTEAGSTPDRVLYWNNAILDAFRQVGGTPGPLTRGGAMMNLAIYDAVNSISTIGKPYLTKDASAASQHGAIDSAVDYAAYTALKNAFPNVDFTAAFNTARALPDRGTAAQRQLGSQLGIKTANAIITNRTNDGSTNTTPYVATVGPGHWIPAPNKPVGGANWGKVKPFALTTGSELRPAKPAGFTTPEQMLKSPEYAAQVNEIKAIGGKNSTVRTPEQTQIAHYWANDVDGTYKPVGQQYDHTIAIYKKHRPYGTSYDSAKLFAKLSVSLADAAIAIWDSKFNTDWDLWRPEHAINFADQVPNPNLVADPTWKPLESDAAGNSFSPNFPTYLSGHSGIAAAWAGAVKNHFGRDDLTFTAGTDDPYAKGVTRTFTSFTAAAQEKADSRKYIGVHFEWDNTAALTLGYQVANKAAARF